MAMIEFKGVSKWYGSFQVLTDCTTSINKGEVVVVCGPSGSGKSTLIKCANALEPFQKGEISIEVLQRLRDAMPRRLDVVVGPVEMAEFYESLLVTLEKFSRCTAFKITYGKPLKISQKFPLFTFPCEASHADCMSWETKRCSIFDQTARA